MPRDKELFSGSVDSSLLNLHQVEDMLDRGGRVVGNELAWTAVDQPEGDVVWDPGRFVKPGTSACWRRVWVALRMLRRNVSLGAHRLWPNKGASFDSE